MKIKKILQFILFIALFFGVTNNAFASNVYFYTKNNYIRYKNDIKIDFYVNATERLNAFQGDIIFSTNYFDFKEINDANSIINLWVKKPEYKNNKISFIGATPGGFVGQNGYLFSVLLEAKKTGESNVETSNIKFLLNDGNGTDAKIQNTKITVIISQSSIYKEDNSGTNNTTPPKANDLDTKDNNTETPTKEEPTINNNENQQPEIIIDKDKPEDFIPVIYFDKNVQGGKYLLIFYTQDKGSGIDHYEVKEGDLESVIANSPYILQNQKVDKDIIVKAFDKQGNIRLAIAKALEQKKDVEITLKFNYKEIIFLVISLLLLIFVLILLIKKKKEDKKNEKDNININ